MTVGRARGRRNFWPAVPAAAAVLLSIALAFAAFVLAPTTAELERKADAALLAGDRATARVWLLRLIAVHPNDGRYQAELRATEPDRKVAG